MNDAGESRSSAAATSLENKRPAGGVRVPMDAGGVIRRISRDKAACVRARGRGWRAAPDRGADRDGAWVDFPGPPDTSRRYQFVDVAATAGSPGGCAGKVVIVGATADNLQDVTSTSTSGDAQMAGPEIHANAIRTVLDGYPLRSAPGGSTSLQRRRASALLAPLAGAPA